MRFGLRCYFKRYKMYSENASITLKYEPIRGLQNYAITVLKLLKLNFLWEWKGEMKETLMTKKKTYLAVRS